MYDTVFEGLYWLFGGVMLVAFVAAIAKTLADLRRPSVDRSQAAGILAIGLGALVALVVGFGLNALRSATGDLFYQQVHFGLFYVGFGLVLWGFDRAGVLGDPGATRGRTRRMIWWGAFAAATGFAVIGLLSPDRYRVVSGGGVSYVQEPLFFLPLFVALVAGAVGLPSLADPARRRTPRAWLAALAGLMLLGMLRESTIIPAA